MKFETVLFAAAFAILAAISFPEQETADAEPETASAFSISFPENAFYGAPDSDAASLSETQGDAEHNVEQPS